MTNKKESLKTIKVLNIAQPNAHNVMHSGKNIENRTMLTKIRGTIAIYASATYQKSRFKNQSIQKESKNVIPLIDWKYLLALIVMALASEWFIRKFNGLI